MKYNNMTLYLTLNCNLKCRYCFCGKKYKDNMTEETAEKAIEFFDNICSEGANITFFGGEPLLRMDLIKYIVNICKERYQKKFSYSITTNGLLLTRENYQFLSDNNIDILLSLDGNKEAQDYNRPLLNGQGSWDIIMKNIDLTGIYFPIRMTVSKMTVSSLADNTIALHKKGFESIAFYLASGEPWNDGDFVEFEKQLIKLTQYLIECYENGNAPRIHWLDKEIRMYIADRGSKCSLGLCQFSVTPNGNIYPCNHTNFEDRYLQLGNIYEGMDESKIAWMKAELARKDPDCTGCKFDKRCSHCNINNYEETGKLWQAPDWYCKANQIVIKQADLMASKLYKARNACFMKKFYGSKAENV